MSYYTISVDAGNSILPSNRVKPSPRNLQNIMVSKKASKVRKRNDGATHSRFSSQNQMNMKHELLQAMMVQKRFGKNQKVTVMQMVENTL